MYSPHLQVCQSCYSPLDQLFSWGKKKKKKKQNKTNNKKACLTYLPFSVDFTWKKQTHKQKTHQPTHASSSSIPPPFQNNPWKSLKTLNCCSVDKISTLPLAQETGTAFPIGRISLEWTQSVFTFSSWIHLSWMRRLGSYTCLPPAQSLASFQSLGSKDSEKICCQGLLI